MIIIHDMGIPLTQYKTPGNWTGRTARVSWTNSEEHPKWEIMGKNKQNMTIFLWRTRGSMSKSGWWFGTFFICPYIGNNNPNRLIFFRGVETTNQKLFIWMLVAHHVHIINDHWRCSTKIEILGWAFSSSCCFPTETSGTLSWITQQ